MNLKRTFLFFQNEQTFAFSELTDDCKEVTIKPMYFHTKQLKFKSTIMLDTKE